MHLFSVCAGSWAFSRWAHPPLSGPWYEKAKRINFLLEESEEACIIYRPKQPWQNCSAESYSGFSTRHSINGFKPTFSVLFFFSPLGIEKCTQLPFFYLFSVCNKKKPLVEAKLLFTLVLLLLLFSKRVSNLVSVRHLIAPVKSGLDGDPRKRPDDPDTFLLAPAHRTSLPSANAPLKCCTFRSLHFCCAFSAAIQCAGFLLLTT